MPECTPETVPCTYRGLAWFDWAWSLFRSLCNVQGWLGAIQDNTSIASFGNTALVPCFAQVDATAAAKLVAIPAGAISIQAYANEAGAADFSLELADSGGTPYLTLPLGVTLDFPAITPVFTADVNGQSASAGTGNYPAYHVLFPNGSTGVVIATYRTAQTLTITTP